MKPGAGKNKGSAFERIICRKLTKWVTGEEKPEIFWRSAASGAQATMSRKKGFKSKMGGDIMAIDERGILFTDYFYCECKTYRELRIEDFLNHSGNLFLFWNKCVKEAEESNKRPLLIFKSNRSKIYMLLENLSCYQIFSKPIDRIDIDISGTPMLGIISLDDFLSCVFYSNFKEFVLRDL
jgi:hypothetical protein